MSSGWIPPRFVLCLALLAGSAAAAQPPASPSSATAPIPPAIQTAKKVFLSNAGADSGLFPSPFSGDPSRGYNQLYTLLKKSGTQELVTDPGGADVVLELRLVAPPGPTNGSKQYGAADPLPMFRMSIYDRQTHFILWTLTASIELALLQKTHDRNFDEAIALLANEYEGLLGKPATP